MTLYDSSNLKPSRWLITGGCGFIGLNLLKYLIKNGNHYIRIIDNLSVGTREGLSQVCNFTEIDQNIFTSQFSILNGNDKKPSISSSSQNKKSILNSPCNIQEKVDLIVGDVLDEKLSINVSQNIDFIVHLAAKTGVDSSVKDPRSDCLNNIVGTLNYLEAARQNNIKRFIFASSGAPLGECAPPIHEEITPHPVSPYGASKLAGEAYCSAYFKTFGIYTVVLRFGNVYGPLSGQKNSVVARFIKRAMEGKPLEIYGDGKQTRDFIFVEDLIRAICLSAASKELGGEIFQIATNAETTIEELVEKFLPILVQSGFKNVETLYKEPRIGDVKRNYSDTSKAQKHLGWRADIELSEGLQRTLKWFLNKQS